MAVAGTAKLRDGVHVIGIGEAFFSGDAGSSIRTYGLGSCVGVCLFDPQSLVTGMIHVALPEAKLNPTMAADKPFHFADTAIALAVKTMLRLGASPKRPKWRIKLAGGASVLKSSATFDIGRRNQVALKRALWAQSMAPIATHVGGHESRTITQKVGEPGVEVYIAHRERVTI
ncbi:MAG: chemotaxis protein CheD [Myxococcota bacterium]